MRQEHLLDVTELEPPLPLQKVLAELSTLPEGDFVRLLIRRDPVLLYPILVTDEFEYLTRRHSETGQEILIWRKGDKVARDSITDLT